MNTILISHYTYPLLHKCWMIIRHNNGATSRLEPEDYFQTAESKENLDKAEHELSNLTFEMLEDFCIGEEKIKDLIKQNCKLDMADYILNEWFGNL